MTLEELARESKSLHEKLLAMQGQMSGLWGPKDHVDAIADHFDAICGQAAALQNALADLSRNSTAGAAATVPPGLASASAAATVPPAPPGLAASSSQTARPLKHARAGAGAAAPLAAQLPPPPPPQEPISPRRYLIYDADAYLHCRLCGRWADENHLTSSKHQSRVENIRHYMQYVLPKEGEPFQ